MYAAQLIDRQSERDDGRNLPVEQLFLAGLETRRDHKNSLTVIVFPAGKVCHDSGVFKENQFSEFSTLNDDDLFRCKR